MGQQTAQAKEVYWDTFQAKIEIWKCWFFGGEGKTREPGEKPLGAEKRTNNKLNPHTTPGPGIEPGARSE